MEVTYRGKVVIATPFYNMQAWSPYVQSLVTTLQVLENLKIPYQYLPMHGDSYVHRARNTLCALFLEDKDATDLFFIDSDESWDAVGFIRVLMSPFNVIGGLYKMKNNWETFCGTLKIQDGNPIGILTGKNEAILEADFIPAGFMRIKREVLEKFITSYPDLIYFDAGADGGKGRQYTSFFDTEINGKFQGEDFTFCERVKKLGEKIYVEPQCSITHYGVKGWEGNLDQQLRNNI